MRPCEAPASVPRVRRRWPVDSAERWARSANSGDNPRAAGAAGGLARVLAAFVLKRVNDTLKGRIAAQVNPLRRPPAGVELLDAAFLRPRRWRRRARGPCPRDAVGGGGCCRATVAWRSRAGGPQLGLRLDEQEAQPPRGAHAEEAAGHEQADEGRHSHRRDHARRRHVQFTDGENATVSASGVTATASLEVDSAATSSSSTSNRRAWAKARWTQAARRAVRRRHRRRRPHLEGQARNHPGVSARSLGGTVKANGSIVLRDPGSSICTAPSTRPRTRGPIARPSCRSTRPPCTPSSTWSGRSPIPARDGRRELRARRAAAPSASASSTSTRTVEYGTRTYGEEDAGLSCRCNELPSSEWRAAREGHRRAARDCAHAGQARSATQGERVGPRHYRRRRRR